MKKKISLILLLALVCTQLSGCSFHWNFDMIKEKVQSIGKKPPTETEAAETLSALDVYNQSITKPVDGKEFEFQTKDINYVVEDNGFGADNEKLIYLYLDDNIYYPIHVPEMLDCLTDNSKYIYASDSSVSISVVSNIDLDSFSKNTFIDNAVAVKSNMVVSEEGKKGPQEAAEFIVNDKAIVVRTYDNPEAYHTIVNGLKTETYREVKENQLVKSLETEELETLPIYTGYHVSATTGFVDKSQKVYNYEDGVLTVSKELRNFETAISNLGAKAAIVSGSNVIDKEYKTDTIYYAEVSNYVIAIYRVNYNTVITCFGYGDEARFNAIKCMEAESVE